MERAVSTSTSPVAALRGRIARAALPLPDTRLWALRPSALASGSSSYKPAPPCGPVAALSAISDGSRATKAGFSALSFFSDATAMVAATTAAFFFAAGSLYTALRLVSAWPSLRSVLQGSGEPQAVGEVETLSPARYVLEDT